MTGGLHEFNRAGNRIGFAQTIECTRIDVWTVTRRRDAGHRGVSRLVGRNIDNHANWEVKLESEIEVALIVRRDSHDGTRAVIGEHVVRRPNRDGFTVDRVRRRVPEEHSRFRSSCVLTLYFSLFLDVLQICGERLTNVRFGGDNELARQVRIGGDNHERRPEQRVGPGCEHRNLSFATVDREDDLGALGPADPVALHRENLGGPGCFEPFKVIEEPIRVIGDAEVPLGELLFDDHRTAAIARAVGKYLLVGEHRLIDRVPVDPRIFAVGETLVVQLQEEPLVPLVVLGVRRVQHATPVEGGRVALHRRALLGDVVVGPFARVDTPLDGGVFRGQAERVPADRVKDAVASKSPVACEHIAECVHLSVSHVEVPRRVGKHVKNVFVRTVVWRIANIVWTLRFPDRSPLRL